MTVYEVNYNTGKDDKASGSKAKLPSTLPDPVAFKGYCDGYTGKDFKEPRRSGIVYIPKYLISDNLIGKEVKDVDEKDCGS